LGFKLPSYEFILKKHRCFLSILYFNTSRQDDNALGKLARDFKEANPKEIQSKVLSHRVASLKEGKLDREGEKI